MPTINELENEASYFRGLIDICDKEDKNLIINCFPVMSCKLTSMLLSYHFLTLWPDIEVTGVSSVTGKNDTITHYWLEVSNVVIDITGDQYNIINSKELTKSIVKHRPFQPIHVEYHDCSYLHEVFRVNEIETFVKGFPTIAENFIESMKLDYTKPISTVKYK
ncbi:hypothetical protein OB952_14285 [Aeromonas salmonicida]|uniref:hypothetical protein n=1 Tax=Aeromonas salmonicida TaxID=645 RepID=UPI00259D688F|nr:hypothetical protein [Aeromonas salmonicida]MDM5068528.1 hypothetical protein [Aeromonas salmonicida]